MDLACKPFDVAILFGQPVLFSFERIDTNEIHDPVFIYEMRSDSSDSSAPLWLEQKVESDYYGTIISKEPIDLNAQYIRSFQTGELVKMRTIEDSDFRMDDFAMATISSYLNGMYELTPEPEKTIRVLIVEPMEPPRVEMVPNTLEAKQAIVGGLIQAIYPYPEEVALVCNDEGKLIGLPLNRRVGHDIIAGNFFICGIDDRTASFSSLTDEQVKRYQEKFSPIEIFIPGNRNLPFDVTKAGPRRYGSER
jgi:hypothetical protein